ncbi:MAG: HYR domain-containing protein, partial [Ilumatobacteraceae bacterium]
MSHPTFVRRLAGLAVIALSIPLGVNIARADSGLIDGDVLSAGVQGGPLSFGDVCANSTVTRDIDLLIERTTQSNQNTFRPGTLSFTHSAIADLSITATNPAAYTLATDWPNLPSNNNSRRTVGRSTITIVAGSTPRTVSSSVNFMISGTNVSNSALSREASIGVQATVISCDTTPPIVNVPATIVTQATGAAGATVGFTVTATDTAPASPAVACTPASGSTFAIATTVVNCSATDTAGNTGVGSFTVSVVDTTGPSFSPVSPLTASATAASGATVTYGSPTATDIVDGSRPVTCVPSSGNTFAVGSTIVTCGAADTRGNSSNANFTVTVIDDTAPVLVLPMVAAAEATGPAGAGVAYVATAIDAVDGPLTAACTPPTGSTFAIGTTTVGCSATDSAGNGASGSFDITVVDTTPPVVTVPASLTVDADGPTGSQLDFTASASDLVSGTLPTTCIPASGSPFPLGATTVTCSATDDAGLDGSASFVATVADLSPPVLHLPADVFEEATGPTNVVQFDVSADDL